MADLCMAAEWEYAEFCPVDLNFSPGNEFSPMSPADLQLWHYLAQVSFSIYRGSVRRKETDTLSASALVGQEDMVSN